MPSLSSHASGCKRQAVSALKSSTFSYPFCGMPRLIPWCIFLSGYPYPLRPYNTQGLNLSAFFPCQTYVSFLKFHRYFYIKNTAVFLNIFNARRPFPLLFFPKRVFIFREICYTEENLSVAAAAAPLPGLRHPASAALRLRLAGRGPNSDSLFPPLAAVVAVAPTEGRPWHFVKLFLFARGSPR